MSELEDARKNLEDALEEIGEEKYYSRLENPEKFLEVNFSVEMDNGEKKSFKGFRSQHSTVRGPLDESEVCDSRHSVWRG
jgi:glutamate dehydrogenase